MRPERHLRPEFKLAPEQVQYLENHVIAEWRNPNNGMIFAQHIVDLGFDEVYYVDLCSDNCIYGIENAYNGQDMEQILTWSEYDDLCKEILEAIPYQETSIMTDMMNLKNALIKLEKSL